MSHFKTRIDATSAKACVSPGSPKLSVTMQRHTEIQWTVCTGKTKLCPAGKRSGGGFGKACKASSIAGK